MLHYAPVNVFHGPPTPGMGRENAGEMRIIDSFCTTGGLWMCGGFYSRVRCAGPGKQEKYGISACHYAGECGRIDDCCLIPGAVGSGIAVEITKKYLEGAV